MSPAQAMEVQLIPREVLFGNPEKAAPQLSPDGTRIAYIAPAKGVLNVWVRTLGKTDDRPVTTDTDRGIRSYFWAQDDRHIFYLQDIGGNENWRLYAVHLETGEVKDLTPFENVQVRPLDTHKDYPDELLLTMNKDNVSLHDVYRLNLKTDTLEKIASNPGNISGWMTDAHFKLRGALAERPDGGTEFLVRESESAEFKTLLVWNIDDSIASRPVSFSKDGKRLYLKDARNADTGRLVELEMETGKLRVIAEDPVYDVGGVTINPNTYVLEIVSFMKARVEYRILDPSIEADIQAIRGLNPGDFFIASRDRADKRWLVGFYVDDGPVRYYTFERSAKEGRFLFESRPDLNEYPLVPMEPISFSSRDGFTIHGYITFPPGKAREKLPLVLNVHGGPWHRDAWRYDPEAQWFANRGYASLQVNFRGSTGYGKKFLNAGNKEWGGKMHEDLVDAVEWAVARGFADPEKIAIYGGSYGGYAALVGATFTPDLFVCAVDVVGPSNLISFIQTIPPYWEVYREEFYRRVGNPETEEAFLKSRSPLFKVDRIKVPLLIAQGANDPRVKQAESEQIVAALRKKGIDHEYLLFPDEGHGFAKPSNRLKFYAAAERFLAKHLGGRFE